MAVVAVPKPISVFRNDTRAIRVIKMLFFSVLILCCVFIFRRNTYDCDAMIVYDPRYGYYNLARGSYGRYYDQVQEYKIRSSAEVTKKKKSHKHKEKSQPPIDISFEPLGALQIDSLTHGQIEINPDKIDDFLLSLASGTISLIPDIYQYVPSIPSFYGDAEPTEASSEDRSRPTKHHRNSEEEDRTEESSEARNENSDDSKHDQSDADKDHEPPEDEDNAAEEHDDDSKQPDADSPERKNNSDDKSDEKEPKSEQDTAKEISEENKNSKEGSEEPVPEVVVPEIPIEGLPQEGYVDKFVRYYSYAKPVAKAASLFVPGLGQYRAVMLGVEMGDLAYNLASMYSNGDGYLKIGYFLGKEAFKRLGRRNEPLSTSQESDAVASSIDSDDFLEKVKTTRYPLLDDEKEQEIRTSVSNIVYKYCHDQEEYQNETKRAEFVDLMISCVKFIALREILPAAPSN